MIVCGEGKLGGVDPGVGPVEKRGARCEADVMSRRGAAGFKVPSDATESERWPELCRLLVDAAIDGLPPAAAALFWDDPAPVPPPAPSTMG